MPLFLSEEEYRLCSGDASAVAERADAFIRDLLRRSDSVRDEADAAAIAAEQTASLLEQRYASLSADISRLQSENAVLSASAEQRLSDLADAQAEKHQLHLKAIEKDGEIERLSLETSELHKSKRQLLELLDQRDKDIHEKNAIIQSHLDKIVNLTDKAISRDARLHELEADLRRSHSTCNHFTQEKGLLEQHNVWLNEELTAKVNSLVELRRKHMDAEAEFSSKLAELENKLSKSSNGLKWNEDRARELELRVIFLEKELCSSKDNAAANEAQFSAELSTATKLAELYKASSEEWSKKAGELEGVIKALEAHVSQVENEYAERHEKAKSVRQIDANEILELKEKLGKCEREFEKTRNANELSLVPLSDVHVDSSLEEILKGEQGTCVTPSPSTSHDFVPKFPIGISGTALATSLLREGWSLAKMYEKYQEVADVLRHEKWGRKHSEAILEQVLREIEQKAELILDERVEHAKLLDKYTSLNEQLQQAFLEFDNYENTIRNLKSELKRYERDHSCAQKEIQDLQKQVTILLKECQDVRLRFGAVSDIHDDSTYNTDKANLYDDSDAECAVSEHLLTYHDIRGLVEINAKLRSLVQSLSDEEDKMVAELREGFQIELQKVTDDAASKVEAVVKRSEEQGHMIESLHCSVAMYKRLYEEERKTDTSSLSKGETIQEDGKELMLLFDSSQGVSKKSHEQLAERTRHLEQDLENKRNELLELQSEHDKLTLEANFATERLNSLMKETEFQRQEANAVSVRNTELSNLLVDHQKRLRGSDESLQSYEDNSRRMSMELSILKQEMDIVVNSEKIASDESRSLSERVHRLQSALDAIQSTYEVCEKARSTERLKHEEYVNLKDREWAEAKEELQKERDLVCKLTHDRENVIKNSLRQVEEMRKELADAWHAVTSAESRAAVAEARCSDLELNNNHSDVETSEDLRKAKEEVGKLKEEAHAYKDNMLQYKEMAEMNGVALKDLESAHEQCKAEAEKLKNALHDEIFVLKNKIHELERSYVLKSEETTSVTEAKEHALSSALKETSFLKDEIAAKMHMLMEMEAQLESLKDDLDKEHKRWQTAQHNYERQVVLQSETIQELTNTSKRLSSFESENLKLQKLFEMQNTEINVLKSLREKEKSQLQESRDEAEKKYNEINEQNKSLLDRLETLHIQLANEERSSAGLSFQISDLEAESDLQNVISHLRRSKEIAETEISLLKLKILQLESALKATESAQVFCSRCENSKPILFKDEEFKSLQIQVREITLLRESNIQLREENKHNFEECQKFLEEAQRAKLVTEEVAKDLQESQFKNGVCMKEIERQKMEIEHLKNKNDELLESCKTLDLEEYMKMANELQQNKENLKNEIGKRREIINNFKKTIESLSKEKEELEKENQAFLKQIEESKSIRETSSEILNKKAMEKEKDSRIQILEKTLERKREDLRKERNENMKEKANRQKTEKTMIDLIHSVSQGRKKVEEELSKLKDAIAVVLERKALPAAQLPPTNILDEETSSYFLSVVNFEESMNFILNHGLGSQPTADILTVDTPRPSPAVGSGTTQHMKQLTNAKAVEERQKGSEFRKGPRKLVRPCLDSRPEESAGDIETLAMEGATSTEGKASTSHEPEHQGDALLHNPQSSGRKRPAPSMASEVREDLVAYDANDDVALAPPHKKPKDTESIQESCSRGHSIPSLFDNPPDTVPQLTIIQSVDSFDAEQPIILIEADHAPTLSNEVVMDVGMDEPGIVTIKGEAEDHQKMNQNSEIQHDFNANAGGVLDKPREVNESVVEFTKAVDEKEMLQTSVEEDDEEEGELMPAELEDHHEDGASGDYPNVSVAAEETGMGNETGDKIEISSPGVLEEKTEISDVNEEVGEGSGVHNSNDDQGSEISSVTRRGSPSTVSRGGVVSDQQSLNPSAGKEEPRDGRTITINESARQNSQSRQRQLSLIVRGRSDDGGRGAGRGLRGRRTGSRRPFSDGEQG